MIIWHIYVCLIVKDLILVVSKHISLKKLRAGYTAMIERQKKSKIAFSVYLSDT